MSNNWNNLMAPPADGAPEEISVPDLNSFLANPTFRLRAEATQFRADLTSANAEELIKRGTSLVNAVDPRTGARVAARIRLQRQPLQAGEGVSPQIVEVKSVTDLVRDRGIRLATGEFVPVALSAQQIHELRNLGITKVELQSGRASVGIFLRTGTTPRGARKISDGGDDGNGVDGNGDHGGGNGIGNDGNGDGGDDGKSGPPLPSFQFVLYLPYKQTWELLGYSRGELVNSISLGPQEETTIEVFTWDRIKRSKETALSFEQEATAESTLTQKDSVETLNELTTSFGWKSDVGANIGLPVDVVKGDVHGNLDMHGDIRDVSRTTHQAITDATQRSTEKIRATRQVKITESEELGREQRVTRKIRNPNMCRTLNLDYFQVLATHDVTTELLFDKIELCLLTPNLVRDPIDRSFVISNEGALRDAMLDPAQIDGFVAVRDVAAWERFCAVACASTCICDETGGVADIKALADAVTSEARVVRRVLNALDQARADDYCTYVSNGTTGGPTDARAKAGKWLYWRVVEAINPRFWSAARSFIGYANPTADDLEALCNAGDPGAIDAKQLPWSLSRTALDVLEQLNAEPHCWFLLVNLLFGVIPPLIYDDGGLPDALRRGKVVLDAYRKAQKAIQQAQQQTVQQMPSAFPPETIARAQVAEQGLLSHLRANESHYRNAIWRRLDSDDRFRILEMAGNFFDYVENEVIGFIGNQAALPIKLNKAPADIQQWFQTNVTQNAELSNQAPQNFSGTLPTQAVAVEARLGECDGCEDFIVEHRRLDLAAKQAEVDRLRSRLVQNPPLLDAPTPPEGEPTIRVVLETSAPSP